jgi:hypothetical protein
MTTANERREAIYEECVKHGHWMGDAPPSTPSPVRFGYVLRCDRGCGTVRHLEINPFTGHVDGSTYDWTAEYKEFRQGKHRGDERLADLKRRRKAARAQRRSIA